MWAWFQRPLQPPHAHPDDTQPASAVQVSHQGMQGSVPQPAETQRAREESAQERLEDIVSCNII